MPKSNSIRWDDEQQLLIVTWKDYNLASVGYIGNCAVQPRWGDGHNAGLFSWNYLRELAGLLPAPQ